MTNKDFVQKGQQYVMNTYARFPIAMEKGKGSYVWDADGKQYLDFLGGIAVCALGHSNEQLNLALQEQAQKLWHVSNLYWIMPQVELAEKLVTESGLGKAFFCNSGAEANEGAIKLARKYFYRRKEGYKNKIIVFNQSFHGRTLATLTATGQQKYQEGYAPLPEGFAYADFNDINSVHKLVSDDTAAIMIEPLQGEGGVIPANIDFLRELRKLCDQKGILLIFDEVQCGMGRTGKLFAFQTYGITPDIITMAKGLGGGFPIGALIATDEAAKGFEPGDHASTFGGNPLATAVAKATVNIIADKQFLQKVSNTAKYLMDNLTKLTDSRLIAVRGRGLMIGIEFNTEVRPLIDLCMQKGLLVGGAGPQVIRMVPPLTISETEVNQAINIFKEALKDWKL